MVQIRAVTFIARLGQSGVIASAGFMSLLKWCSEVMGVIGGLV